MATSEGLLSKLDVVVDDIFAGWGTSTTIIATLFLVVLTYPLFFSRDPDIHPLLLARQAVFSPVRQPEESAVYRSAEVPYGYPLRSGLNVKDPETPKWSVGRDGDLRDIWIQAEKALKPDGSVSSSNTRFLTVLGKQRLEERIAETVSLDINIIGKHLRTVGSTRVALCLSNSVELLASIFAASFYGIHPILVPFGSTTEELILYLQKTKSDALVTEAGVFNIDQILSQCSQVSQVLWVTKSGNKHMAFSEQPHGVDSKVNFATWDDLVDEFKSPENTKTPLLDKSVPGASLSIVEAVDGDCSVVEYTSANIVSAIAALINSLPRHQRISTDDIILPTTPLTSIYPLTLTLAALYSNATIALNSVASEKASFALIAATTQPTIMISSALSAYHNHCILAGSHRNLAFSLSAWWQSRSLHAGHMSEAPSFALPQRHSWSSKLRLLFIYRDVEDRDSAGLSGTMLRQLKIWLGARTCCALTAKGVAGAVVQSNIFDYRSTGEKEGRFGPPLSSVEIVLKGDEAEGTVGGLTPRGRIVVRGPAVVRGGREIDVEGEFGEDGTLSLS